jgi:AcrR family transcriptional regulator
VSTTIKTRLTRDERVEQLLDVAETRFAEQGYDATSIDGIARAAGISRPIVYEHFGSKEGIYLACMRRARAALDQALATSVTGVEEAEHQLAAGIDATFSFIESEPARWAILFNGVALTGAVAQEAMRLRFATVGVIADLLHAVNPERPRQEAEAFAHALSGAGEQLERWWRQNPDIPRQAVVDYLFRFAWSGLSQLMPERGGQSK